MGTALIGLLGSAVGAFSNASSAEASAEINAYIQSNKDLIRSTQMPLILVGGMVTIGILASVLKGRK